MRKTSPRYRDLSGMIFGKLTAKRYNHTLKSNAIWECLCECGNTSFVSAHNLKSGKSISCGCARPKNANGMAETLIYKQWANMRNRCNNKKNYSYANYGGRGIYVCEEWNKSFLTFNEWAEKNNWKKGLSIERIDNNGPYSPDNCKLITMAEQASNKRNNVFLEFNGKRLTIAQWSRELGIKAGTISNRVLKGWSIENVLSVENLKGVLYGCSAPANRS